MKSWGHTKTNKSRIFDAIKRKGPRRKTELIHDTGLHEDEIRYATKDLKAEGLIEIVNEKWREVISHRDVMSRSWV